MRLLSPRVVFLATGASRLTTGSPPRNARSSRNSANKALPAPDGQGDNAPNRYDNSTLWLFCNEIRFLHSIFYVTIHETHALQGKEETPRARPWRGLNSRPVPSYSRSSDTLLIRTGKREDMEPMGISSRRSTGRRFAVVCPGGLLAAVCSSGADIAYDTPPTKSEHRASQTGRSGRRWTRPRARCGHRS